MIKHRECNYAADGDCCAHCDCKMWPDEPEYIIVGTAPEGWEDNSIMIQNPAADYALWKLEQQAELLRIQAGCICLNGDTWRCIKGEVYGPCSSDDCGGVCEAEGRCTCEVCHVSGSDLPASG